MNEEATPSDPEEKPEAVENNNEEADSNVSTPMHWDTGELSRMGDPDETDQLTVLMDDATTPLEAASFIRTNTTVMAEKKEPIIKVAKRCHVGAIRERNEDSCLLFSSDSGGHFAILPFGLYIVADGMGGHQNGHLASRTASRVVARNVLNRIYMPLLQIDANPIQAPIQEVMTDAVQAAHRAVSDPDPENDGGTTLTAALILGRRLYIAHVGDSRAYLKTEEKLEMLTTDHSLVQRLQDVGQLTAEEAPFYQYRNVLLKALGQGDEIDIDTNMRLLPKAGRLLLCSDGLCGLISDDQIDTIMSQEIPLQQMADELFEAAMEAGGYDNITAVLVDFQL